LSISLPWYSWIFIVQTFANNQERERPH
jgi:hypothetical protein